MVGGLMPVRSLQDLQDLLETGQNKIGDSLGYSLFGDSLQDYAFYSVLMYTPTNSLNEKLREYVVSHSRLLHAQTGFNWLVFVLEDINLDHTIDKFRPEDIYNIARFLGATVVDVPGLVFFTEPKKRTEILVVPLEELLPPSDSVSDKDLTELFGTLTTIIDSCSEVAPDRRLDCLLRKLDSEWPQDFKQRNLPVRVADRAKIAIVPAATVANAITNVLTYLGKVM